MKYLLRFATILIFFIFPQIAKARCTVFPTGIYSSHLGQSDSVLKSPIVQGVLVRARWADIEIRPGQFDFSSIDHAVDRIKASGKNWSLAILAGPHSPEWLKTAPYNSFSLNTARFGAVNIPDFKDTAVLERINILASALGERYAKDNNLVLVYVPQMTLNGIEGHFNGISLDTLEQTGLNAQTWTNAIYLSASAFAHHFPEKAIAVELHEIYRSTEIPLSIIEKLETAEDTRAQIGFGIWWLSGKYSYQKPLLEYFKTHRKSPVFAQLIGHSGQPKRFQDGSINTAIQQAKDLGIRYIEAWNYEFEKTTDTRTLDEFNDWAKKQNASQACDQD